VLDPSLNQGIVTVINRLENQNKGHDVEPFGKYAIARGKHFERHFAFQ
jgi:hypothetical protein